MGVVTSTGHTVKEYADSLMAGCSGIGYWKNIDNRCLSKIGGDLSDFRIKNFFVNNNGYPNTNKIIKLLNTTPMAGHLAAAACLQAYEQAGYFSDHIRKPDVFGHILGGHNINGHYIYSNALAYLEEPEYIEPLYGLLALDTDVLSIVSELLGIRGPSYTVGGACASSNLAIINALDLIRSGRAEAVMVTGSNSDVDPVCLQGWAIMNSLSYGSYNDEPTKASRPFDAKREGFVPGHGAGALLLESLEFAKARGAVILAELLGGGYASDATRLPKPHRDGQVTAMQLALKDAGIKPADINYINAHATSTPLGDSIEVSAIKEVFGKHAYHLAVNSTKSMIGHCLLAAGMVEAVATIIQLQQQKLHPTINLDEQDPELDLDFVPNKARQHAIDVALSNSFGFGGINSAIVLSRYHE